METCKHECVNCEEKWECTYTYYSDFKFFKTTVNSGYYCNSFCPSCQKKERADIDLLFGDMSETGYIKTFDETIIKSN